jgi:hypothetical protein
MTAPERVSAERMTAPECDAQSGCITCGDEGIPMRVLEVRADGALCVDDDGGRHEVAIELIDAAPGGRVLVHAGVAIGAL